MDCSVFVGLNVVGLMFDVVVCDCVACEGFVDKLVIIDDVGFVTGDGRRVVDCVGLIVC